MRNVLVAVLLAIPVVSAADPDLSVTWKPSASPKDVDQPGRYMTAGFPAVSSDGTTILVAIAGSDDAHGTPHLRLVTFDNHGKLLASYAMPKLQPTKAPTAAALAGATKFIRAGTRSAWHPLVWHAIALRDGGGGAGKRATLDGYEVAIGSDESILKLSKGDRTVVDKIDLVKSAAPDDKAGCGGTSAHLSGIAIDDAHRVAVLSAARVTRDGCYPDDGFLVVGWDAAAPGNSK